MVPTKPGFLWICVQCTLHHSFQSLRVWQPQLSAMKLHTVQVPLFLPSFAVASDGSGLPTHILLTHPAASARHSKCCGWFGGMCTQAAHLVIARETE